MKRMTAALLGMMALGWTSSALAQPALDAKIASLEATAQSNRAALDAMRNTDLCKAQVSGAENNLNKASKDMDKLRDRVKSLEDELAASKAKLKAAEDKLAKI